MKIELKAEYIYYYNISEHNSDFFCLYTLTKNYDTIVIEACKNSAAKWYDNDHIHVFSNESQTMQSEQNAITYH